MALLYGLNFQHQGAGSAIPHVLSYLHARTVPGDKLLSIWNGPTIAAEVFAVDLNGVVAAGGLTLAGGSTSPSLTVTTTGAINSSLRYDGSNRLDVGVGATGAVTYTAVGAGAAHSFGAQAVTMGALSVAAVTASGLITANAGVTVASGQTLTLTGATVTGLTAASVAAGTFPAGSFSMPTLAVTSGLTLTGATITGQPTWSSAQTIPGLTIGANTLALASATVSGTPTWSSSQAITLSTAAQPNITSVGTLTSLGVGAITTTGLFKQNSKSGIVCADGALATSATAGFLYLPTSAGTPIGAAGAQTGTAASEYDTTNDILYVYNGSWKGVGLWA